VDRVVGLEIGADDTSPNHSAFGNWCPIRVRLRRHTPAAQDSDAKLRFGKVEVDFDKHEATRAGSRVELTAKELEVLRLLALHRGENRHRDACWKRCGV